MLKNCRAILVALLFWCGLTAGVAQITKPRTPGSPFVVSVWDTAEGLPDGTVLSLLQAHDGYLWVGTLHGLARFDGLHFIPFDEKDLAGSRIVHLFEDSRSNLWVGTDNTGILVFKRNGEVNRLPFGKDMPNGGLAQACEDTSGTVWLRLANGAVGRWLSNRVQTVGQFQFIAAETNGPVWLARGSEMYQVVTPPGSTAAGVQQMQAPADLKFLAASRSGGVWCFAGGQVQKWENNKMARDLGPYPWGDTEVMAVCEDDRGNLIVGTYGAGVYWFDEHGNFTHLESELSHSSVLSMAFDNEGNLWVGSNGNGLNRVRRSAFSVLPQSSGLVVQSVSADERGGVWIGYNGNRVDYWGNGLPKTNSVVDDPREVGSTYVKSVFVANDGKIFAGIWGSFGTKFFERNAGGFVPANVGIGANVSAIHQDRSGRLWIGTQGGLVLFDGRNSKLYSAENGLPSSEVRAIADDAEGNLWVGTAMGLAKMKDGNFTVFHEKDGLPGEDISSLWVDSDAVLWVGTRGSGLGRFAKGKWTHYTTSEGLAANSIGYIFEDDETNLWLGSNTGLMRVPKKSLNDFAAGLAPAVTCRTYVEQDGLPTRECTEGSQPAAAATPDGKLWFPTTRGLVFVNPSALKTNLIEPPVIIESVLVQGQQQDTNLFGGGLSKIVVPPGKRDIEIHYASLNLGAADRSRFRYRLNEKGEAAWTKDESANRVATYQKLTPGTYQFQVTACNEDGIWNSHPATLAVVVEPSLWQKEWFQALIAACVLAAIGGLIYYFSTQKLQRQLAILKQQEALEHERGRIARDLHDQLGANLTQVALLAEMAESDKNIPEEIEDHAKQISQTARETTKSLDEIVWAVNPSNDTLEGLVNYSSKYAQEYFALAGLRYRADIPTELPEVSLPPEVRHNVFLAFKESVNNVVKHAQATEARVRLRLENQSFAFEIEDNGRGPAGAATKSGRNGLRNMRKRMEDVGGSFSIGPAAERGTIVRLTAPIKIRSHAH